MTGTIKSFSASHGFGFIGGGQVDIYFHVKDWLSEGKPQQGDQVWFVLKKSERGFRAYKVRKL